MEIQAYKKAMTMFNNLLSRGFKNTERTIIRAGIIKITEKIIKSPGDVGPMGVCSAIIRSSFPGVMS